jgi:AcrR family transcriptional regulator
MERIEPLVPPLSTGPGARLKDIQDVALSLFAERGYHGTSMSHIAAIIGVRVPSLYSHIHSKQSLLGDIFDETTRAVWREFQQAVAGVDDVREQLRRAIEAYALRHATHRREALVVHRDLPALEEPVHSEVVAVRRRHEQAVRELIDTGIESGVFRVASATMASFAMLEMSVSIASWFREDGPLSAEAVARQYGEFALAIAAGPAEARG